MEYFREFPRDSPQVWRQSSSEEEGNTEFMPKRGEPASVAQLDAPSDW